MTRELFKINKKTNPKMMRAAVRRERFKMIVSLMMTLSLLVSIIGPVSAYSSKATVGAPKIKSAVQQTSGEVKVGWGTLKGNTGFIVSVTNLDSWEQVGTKSVSSNKTSVFLPREFFEDGGTFRIYVQAKNAADGAVAYKDITIDKVVLLFDVQSQTAGFDHGHVGLAYTVAGEWWYFSLNGFSQEDSDEKDADKSWAASFSFEEISDLNDTELDRYTNTVDLTGKFNSSTLHKYLAEVAKGTMFYNPYNGNCATYVSEGLLRSAFDKKAVKKVLSGGDKNLPNNVYVAMSEYAED